MIKEIVTLTVMKVKFSSIFLLALLISGFTLAQPVNYAQAYQTAKGLLDKGNYSAALNGFADLLNSDPAHERSAYTTFFYSIAAYHLNQKEQARDMLLQEVKKYPSWGNINEAYLWLSKISFELDNPNQGILYANKVSNDPAMINKGHTLKAGYLSQLDINSLKALLPLHEDEIDIARILAKKLAEEPYKELDREYLGALISHYNLDSITLGLTVPVDVFKDRYKIVVMLPVFVDRLWESGVYMQKSLAVDIYEGIRMAYSELDTTKYELEVFDTKKDKLTTQNILKSGRLDGADAIIGPLYPQPISLVEEYSYDHKVNFLNPVSTNSQLIKENPYAFLLRTGAESIGKIIAEYTHRKFTNRACAIYYGPRVTDSLTAYNYSTRMEADSFYVAIRQKTQTTKAREIFDSLTSSVPVVDSVALQKMWKEGEKVRYIPMKDSLLLPVDSLGHIFIASDNKAIASEVMAAVTSRGDTTQIVGVGNWFSVANAGLDLMENLGVWLAMQEFENMLSQENLRISRVYRDQYHKKPSKYVLYGYYAMKFLSSSLAHYGVYFQNGYNSLGNVDNIYDYSGHRDNQHLVLYKIEEGMVEKLTNHERE